MAFKARLACRFFFEAAHRMPTFPVGHPNERIHGHTYNGEVIVEGIVNPKTGFVIDHADIKSRVDRMTSELDHFFLNDIPDLGLPTSENISRWIWKRLKSDLPDLVEVRIYREPLGISVSYFGEELGG